MSDWYGEIDTGKLILWIFEVHCIRIFISCHFFQAALPAGSVAENHCWAEEEFWCWTQGLEAWKVQSWHCTQECWPQVNQSYSISSLLLKKKYQCKANNSGSDSLMHGC